MSTRARPPRSTSFPTTRARSATGHLGPLVVGAALLVAACGGSEDDAGFEGGEVDLGDGNVVEVPGDSPTAVVAELGLETETPIGLLDGRVVVIGAAGELVSIDPTGPDLVTNEFDEDVRDIVGTLDDTLYIRTNTAVVGVAGDDLTEVVRYEGPELDEVRAAALTDDTVVVFYQGMVAGHDRTTGEARWAHPATSLSNTRLFDAAGDTVAYVQADFDTETAVLVGRDLETGEELNTLELPYAGPAGQEIGAVLGGGEILLVTHGAERHDVPSLIERVDLATGDVVWQVEGTTWFEEAGLDDDTAVVANQVGAVYLIDLETGEYRTVPTEEDFPQRRMVRHELGWVGVLRDGTVVVIDPVGARHAVEPLPLEAVDDIGGWVLDGDVLYVTTTESIINDDDDPTTLWGIDLTALPVND